MSKIRILSDALASQVAAGEVVERPSAVIRELVENSLDAGATHIEVAVQRGGTALLRVVDNGIGMSREDALLCIERHATSKIHTKEDLAAIRTFGFRGEAIPSIASVSRFRLASRPKDDLHGTEIEIHGGKLIEVKEYGGAPGTVVEARSLFYNVPARRKFLRSENTEFAHIEQQFRLHAIANPKVAFTLLRDGNLIFHLPATASLQERIEGLSGREIRSRLIAIPPFEYHQIKVSGFIGAPGVSRTNKQMQLCFLNGRPVESPTIVYGLREGYHNALMKGQYPISFLFLELEPDRFDINVHPAKKEVRFHDSIAVREAITRAVASALEGSNTLSSGHLLASELKAQQNALPETTESHLEFPSLPAKQNLTSLRASEPLIAAATSKSVPSLTIPDPSLDHAPSSAPSSEESIKPQVPDSAPSSPEIPNFRFLGILHKIYVLLEGKDGLVLMDQHAAHERVLYEKVKRAWEEKGVPSQKLLFPITLELSPRDFDLISQNVTPLQKLGFEAEPFGRNSFKFDSIPSFLTSDDPHRVLTDLLHELTLLSSRSSNLRLGEDVIATTACRQAVKANDNLQESEIQSLIQNLFACDMPYCCPHGRPTLIQMTLGELDRKFGRRAPN